MQALAGSCSLPWSTGGGCLGHVLVADLASSQWAECREKGQHLVPERKECGLARIVSRNYDLVHVKPRYIEFPWNLFAFDESFTLEN